MTERIQHPVVPSPVPEECVLAPGDADLLFGGARTAYAFTDEPVTDADLRAIYELAQWTPTAVNAQPLRVVAVRSEPARERLLDCLPRGNREQAASAPLTLVCAADRASPTPCPGSTRAASATGTSWNPAASRCGNDGRARTPWSRPASSSWPSAPSGWPPGP